MDGTKYRYTNQKTNQNPANEDKTPKENKKANKATEKRNYDLAVEEDDTFIGSLAYLLGR